MYRCIIFPKLFPFSIPEFCLETRTNRSIGEGETAEQAMMLAAEPICQAKQLANNILHSLIYWQPQTGLVEVNGTCCGVVYKVTGDIR